MNIGIPGLIFVVLLVVKLLELAAISWWVVIGVPLAIWLFFVFLAITIVAIATR